MCHSYECHSDECHSAECHSDECHSADCHSAECHSAECHSAECHSAECHGANDVTSHLTKNSAKLFFNYSFSVSLSTLDYIDSPLLGVNFTNISGAKSEQLLCK